MPKAVISASVHLDVASRIAEEAQRQGRSISEIVNEVLTEYVKNELQRSGRKATVTQHDQRA